MRGTAPMIVALAGVTILGEHLSPTAWGGIVLVSGGVVAMATTARRATYAEWRSLSPTRWSSPANDHGRHRRRRIGRAGGIHDVAHHADRDPGGRLDTAAAQGLRGLRAGARTRRTGGRAGSVTAYALSLWAMTVAPVAVVAALRETSIVFAMGIAAVALKEKIGFSRIVAAALIAAGAAALRLA